MVKNHKSTLTCIAITIIATLAGCGTATNGTTPTTNTAGATTNSLSNIAAIATAPTQSTSASSMLSISVPLATGQLQPSTISLLVPEGWMEQKVGQGSTTGYAWVDPSDQKQQIQLITSSNIATRQDPKTNQWDVTKIFGSTLGVSWTKVASDKLTARFTDTSGTTMVALSPEKGQIQYEGYGEAFIIQKPNPFAVYVEVWGEQGLASAVLSTVQLQQ